MIDMDAWRLLLRAYAVLDVLKDHEVLAETELVEFAHILCADMHNEAERNGWAIIREESILRRVGLFPLSLKIRK